MEIARTLAHFRVVSGKGSAVAWGVFDGMHKGHAALVGLARRRAGELGAACVVIPFAAHPKSVLHGRKIERLTTDTQRLRILSGWGVDVAIPLDFDARFAAMTARTFVDEVLLGALATRAVVIGPDTRFGKDREGDAAFLRREGGRAGFSVDAASPVWVTGEAVSSSRIRRCVAAGDLSQAAACLGRDYAIEGVVVKGDGRGGSIGIPTANLDVADQILPPNGVWAGRATAEGKTFPAVANIGVRPTFGGGERPRIEVHLLDFSGDLYGQVVEFAFVARIRDETRFDGADSLVRQITRDIADARRRLGPA